MMAAGDPVRMRRLRDELVGKDYFQTFPDFNAYLVRKEETVRDCAAAPPPGPEPEGPAQHRRGRVFLRRPDGCGV